MVTDRQTDRQTDRHTHTHSSVTLAALALRVNPLYKLSYALLLVLITFALLHSQIFGCTNFWMQARVPGSYIKHFATVNIN